MSLRHFTAYLRTQALKALACLLALCAVAPALAQSTALLQTTLFMDASGQLGVDAMASQTFKPVANPFSRSYTDAVAWVKLEVAPSAAPELVPMRSRQGGRCRKRVIWWLSVPAPGQRSIWH